MYDFIIYGMLMRDLFIIKSLINQSVFNVND